MYSGGRTPRRTELAARRNLNFLVNNQFTLIIVFKQVFSVFKHNKEPKNSRTGLFKYFLVKHDRNLPPFCFFFSLFKLIQITIVHFVRLFCLCLCLFCFFSFLCSFRRLRFLARGTRSGAARGHGSSLRHHFAFEVNGQIVKQTKQKQKTKHYQDWKSPPPSSSQTGRRNAKHIQIYSSNNNK